MTGWLCSLTDSTNTDYTPILCLALQDTLEIQRKLSYCPCPEGHLSLMTPSSTTFTGLSPENSGKLHTVNATVGCHAR